MPKQPLAIALGCVLALTLVGCERKATGQVVAVVNGDEISQADLNAELRQSGTATNEQQKKASIAQALQRLVDRQLLVQQAKARNLDKDPEYLRQSRRNNDDLLIGLLGKQVGGNIGIPTTSEINDFAAANPQMFGARALYNLQQIQFPLPAQGERLKVLEKDKTLDAVARTLDGLGIPFERTTAAMDSATTPPELLVRVLALPPGEPFVITSLGRVYVSVITGKTARPVEMAGNQAAIADAVRQKKLRDLAAKQLSDAKRTAKIELQPGFSLPPAALSSTK